MKLTRLIAILACPLSLSATAVAEDNDPPHPGFGGGHMGFGGGHFADSHGAWALHSTWYGAGRGFDHSYWQGGHWGHGIYGSRLGWWWIVGPDWYWYPAEAEPYSDPYTPPNLATGYWYWCDTYQQYYPYVGPCPSGWRPAQPQ